MENERKKYSQSLVKFIYSEEATKFCDIFPILSTTVHTVKNKGNILQNFVAFSEYMNFKKQQHHINIINLQLQTQVHFMSTAMPSLGLRPQARTYRSK